MLDDDLGLLGEVVLVQADEAGDGPPGGRRFVLGVVEDGFLDAPVGRVGDVVGQHVEDEALLDRLAHGVEVERLELPLGVARAEQLQGLGLRRGREGEETEVGWHPPGGDCLRQCLLHWVLGLRDESYVLRFRGGELLLLIGAQSQP